MTPAELAASVRYRTRTNATTFTNADMLVLLNDRMDELAQDILKANEKILLIPQTVDLVASTTEVNREYALPDDILSRITRVEAALDGTNWIKLHEKAMTDIDHPLTETFITNNYANLEDEAFFFLTRKALFILSGTVTAGTNTMKLYVNTWPTHITDLTDTTDMSVDPSTTTHGLPRALHNVLRMGITIDYKESREKPIPLSERERNYEAIKQAAINTLKRAYEDRDIQGFLPGSEKRWDEGYDL